MSPRPSHQPPPKAARPLITGEAAAAAADNAAGFIGEAQMELLKSGSDLIVAIPWPADPARQVGLRAVPRHLLLVARAQARLDSKEYCNANQKDDEDPSVTELCFRDLVVAVAYVKLDPARRGHDGKWTRYTLNPGEEPALLFPTVNDVRDRLAHPLVEVLFQLYDAHEGLVLPITQAENAGDNKRIAELVEHLKKEPGSPVLSVLQRETLEAVARFMAAEPREPYPPNKSSGTGS